MLPVAARDEAHESLREGHHGSPRRAVVEASGRRGPGHDDGAAID